MRHLVLALALCCMVASNAVAKPLKTTLVGHASQMIGSDGARFAAWHDEDLAAADVYDAVRRTTTRVAPPAGCVVSGIGATALVATCDAYPFRAIARCPGDRRHRREAGHGRQDGFGSCPGHWMTGSRGYFG
jgi:hypothetical protein